MGRRPSRTGDVQGRRALDEALRGPSSGTHKTTVPFWWPGVVVPRLRSDDYC